MLHLDYYPFYGHTKLTYLDATEGLPAHKLNFPHKKHTAAKTKRASKRNKKR